MTSDETAAGSEIESATLSVEEAGRLLGIGRDASYRAAHAGELPVLKLGRRLRVPRIALQHMLEGTNPRATAVRGENRDRLTNETA